MSIVTRALKRWWARDPATHGAALAYYSIFSIAPMLIIFVAVLGKIFGGEAVRERFLNAVAGFAGADATRIIEPLIGRFSHPAYNIATALLGTVLIVVGALALFSQVQRSLEDLWSDGVMHRAARTFFRTKILAVGMIVILGLLIAVSFLVSAAVPVVAHLVQNPSLAYLGPVITLIDAVSSGISFIYIIFLFTLMYKYLPGQPVSWSAAFQGSLAGGILFFIGRVLVNLYITHVVILSVYGTAGAIIAILLWFYYSAQLFFFGGALAYAADAEARRAE